MTDELRPKTNWLAIITGVAGVCGIAWGMLLLAGCGTAGVTTFDRCNTGRVIDACSPDDLPPLSDQLPRWPFPALIEEPKEQPQPSDTPGHGLIQKLTK